LNIIMEKAEQIKYWADSSDRDYKTMHHLYEKKDYNWALFLGHLVIEKLLKAYFVKNVNNKPPFIINLLRLAVTIE
jgi:HEPN domain-containing protein